MNNNLSRCQLAKNLAFTAETRKEVYEATLFNKILNLESNIASISEAREFCSQLMRDTQQSQQHIKLLDNEIEALNPHELSHLLVEHVSNLHSNPFDFIVDDDVLEFILLQYSPQGILNGALLQNSSNASNCHQIVPSLLHRIHSNQVGNGEFSKNKNILFRQMLQSIDIVLPDVNSSAFSEHPDILEVSWKIPACLLSLSLLPNEKLPEILGVTLFDALFGVPQIVQNLEAFLISKNAFTAYYRTKKSEAIVDLVENARLAIESYLSSFKTTDNQEESHLVKQVFFEIVNSINLFYQLQMEWSSEITNLIENAYLSPEQKMIRMVRNKGRDAIGYHGRILINKINFDEAIAGDAADFVNELAKSKWICPGYPEKSIMTTKLLKFGGPMFRIFSPKELQTIKEWITFLPSKKEVGASHDLKCISVTPHAKQKQPIMENHQIPTRHSSAPITQRIISQQPHIRDLYHQLVNVEVYPEILPFAHKFALNWLDDCAIAICRGSQAIPFQDYSHQQLRNWFYSQARKQAESYSQLTSNIEKTREQVIDEAIQLCPMTLVDGAWLQKCCSPGLIDTKIGAILYTIYSDEIGNGDILMNHPNVYKILISSMQVNLPEFGTKEFAYWEGFNDSAFRVPVFWLSISHFPRRFMPELLGLNLAMELSGVGGAYRTAKDELKHYGFSPLFVELHNTIDNVSTGHSFMALKAIEYYMEDILMTNDVKTICEYWERIWIGYRALLPPEKTWKSLFVRHKKYIN